MNNKGIAFVIIIATLMLAKLFGDRIDYSWNFYTIAYFGALILLGLIAMKSLQIKHKRRFWIYMGIYIIIACVFATVMALN